MGVWSWVGYILILLLLNNEVMNYGGWETPYELTVVTALIIWGVWELVKAVKDVQ